MSIQTDQRQVKATIIDELRALVGKSIEANIRMLQNGSDLLRQAANRELDLSELTERGRVLLREAFADYVRLNTAHTSRLIDLNLAVSNGLLGRPAAPPGQTGERTLFDMKLRGKPGSLCESAFAVASDRPASVNATFVHSLFVCERGETALDVPVSFDPPTLEIRAGERRRVIVSLTIPTDAMPGVYQTLVTSEALPGMAFRLLLEIEADVPNAASQGAGVDAYAGATPSRSGEEAARTSDSVDAEADAAPSRSGERAAGAAEGVNRRSDSGAAPSGSGERTARGAESVSRTTTSQAEGSERRDRALRHGKSKHGHKR